MLAIYILAFLTSQFNSGHLGLQALLPGMRQYRRTQLGKMKRAEVLASTGEEGIRTKIKYAGHQIHSCKGSGSLPPCFIDKEIEVQGDK
jgi:hypothetical protein